MNKQLEIALKHRLDETLRKSVGVDELVQGPVILRYFLTPTLFKNLATNGSQALNRMSAFNVYFWVWNCLFELESEPSIDLISLLVGDGRRIKFKY
jgi:hypothetical protein